MRASSLICMTNSLSPDYAGRGSINMDSIGEQETKGKNTAERKNGSLVMVIN